MIKLCDKVLLKPLSTTVHNTFSNNWKKSNNCQTQKKVTQKKLKTTDQYH